LRNGSIWREFVLDQTFVRTNISLVEQEAAWYCVRVFGPRNDRGITGAFYFQDRPYRPPQPVAARVLVKVIDAETGTPVPSAVREITLFANAARNGPLHRLEKGTERLCVPVPMGC